jgi:hypothetical protein
VGEFRLAPTAGNLRGSGRLLGLGCLVADAVVACGFSRSPVSARAPRGGPMAVFFPPFTLPFLSFVGGWRNNRSWVLQLVIWE